jgi:hypothetical protein
VTIGVTQRDNARRTGSREQFFDAISRRTVCQGTALQPPANEAQNCYGWVRRQLIGQVYTGKHAKLNRPHI